MSDEAKVTIVDSTEATRPADDGTPVARDDNNSDNPGGDPPTPRSSSGQWCKDDECIFCTERLDGQPAHTTKCCGRTMHMLCMVKWTMTNARCPFCDKKLEPLDVSDRDIIVREDGIVELGPPVGWARLWCGIASAAGVIIKWLLIVGAVGLWFASLLLTAGVDCPEESDDCKTGPSRTGWFVTLMVLSFVPGIAIVVLIGAVVVGLLSELYEAIARSFRHGYGAPRIIDQTAGAGAATTPTQPVATPVATTTPTQDTPATPVATTTPTQTVAGAKTFVSVTIV